MLFYYVLLNDRRPCLKGTRTKKYRRNRIKKNLNFKDNRRSFRDAKIYCKEICLLKAKNSAKLTALIYVNFNYIEYRPAE